MPHSVYTEPYSYTIDHTPHALSIHSKLDDLKVVYAGVLGRVLEGQGVRVAREASAALAILPVPPAIVPAVTTTSIVNTHVSMPPPAPQLPSILA